MRVGASQFFLSGKALLKTFKGTVQRELTWVKSGIRWPGPFKIKTSDFSVLMHFIVAWSVNVAAAKAHG
jgi:hypothetical protein